MPPAIDPYFSSYSQKAFKRDAALKFLTSPATMPLIKLKMLELFSLIEKVCQFIEVKPLKIGSTMLSAI